MICGGLSGCGGRGVFESQLVSVDPCCVARKGVIGKDGFNLGEKIAYSLVEVKTDVGNIIDTAKCCCLKYCERVGEFRPCRMEVVAHLHFLSQ